MHQHWLRGRLQCTQACSGLHCSPMLAICHFDVACTAKMSYMQTISAVLSLVCQSPRPSELEHTSLHLRAQS